MSDVECEGNESRLIDCPYTLGGSGNRVTMECSYYSKLFLTCVLSGYRARDNPSCLDIPCDLAHYEVWFFGTGNS